MVSNFTSLKYLLIAFAYNFSINKVLIPFSILLVLVILGILLLE